MSLVFSGVYWGSGYVANQNEGGYLYSNLGMVTKNSHSISLDITTGTVNPVGQSQKLHYFALRYPYGSTSARSYPVSLVFSGRYSLRNGEVGYQDSYSYTWSSTTTTQETVSALQMRDSIIMINPNFSKMLGFALRCVNFKHFDVNRILPIITQHSS